MRGRLADLDRRLAGAAPRRVLFVVWTDPLISVGRDTFIADALRRAGGRSVVDTKAEWPHVSLEEIVRLQPEVLVFASAHAGDTQRDIDALRTRPGWRNLDSDAARATSWSSATPSIVRRREWWTPSSNSRARCTRRHSPVAQASACGVCTCKD